MRSITWMALAAATTLAACGDDNGSTGPGSGGPRSFSAEVTGDVQTSVKGAALFGQVQDDQWGQVFGLEMAEDTPGESVIQIIRLGGEIPAPGTYTIADGLNGAPQDGDFVAMAFDSENGQPTAIFVATGGTVRVTARSASAFKGTFAFDAQGGLFNDPESTLTIAVSGSFHATPASQGITLNGLRSLKRSR